jgi:hypothetical protein
MTYTEILSNKPKFPKIKITSNPQDGTHVFINDQEIQGVVDIGISFYEHDYQELRLGIIAEFLEIDTEGTTEVIPTTTINKEKYKLKKIE